MGVAELADSGGNVGEMIPVFGVVDTLTGKDEEVVDPITDDEGDIVKLPKGAWATAAPNRSDAPRKTDVSCITLRVCETKV